MARLPEVVTDAAVVCKWFISEKDTERALALRKAHLDGRLRIIAPGLMCYELANALRHYPRMTPARLRDAVRSFFDFQVALVPASSINLELASEFALHKKLTMYDSIYAVLAETHSCALITSDLRLLEASDRAIPVSEWSLQT